MKEVVILGAKRTPIGKYRGALSELSSVELAVKVTQGLINTTNIDPQEIDQVIFGSVLQAGQGQNVARQISIKSGLDVTIPASTINEVCGSGMKAAVLARQAIALGENELVLAGGTENMSQADYLHQDGLTDAMLEYPMGLTAETMAERYGITREEQDAFALESHQKSMKADFSAEMIELPELSQDESIRPDTSMEKMAKLKPVFKEDGTVTAANASPVNDGAAALLLASQDYAETHDLPYLSIIKGVSEVGVEPVEMSIAPIKAIRQLLEKTSLTIDDIDIFEINEAFAASSIIIERELGLDHSKVNPQGGALSIGHPLGMTGARLLTNLSHQLNSQNRRYGIASLCIGGGMGLAILLENPNYKLEF